jgi:hypothetical protein
MSVDPLVDRACQGGRIRDGRTQGRRDGKPPTGDRRTQRPATRASGDRQIAGTSRGEIG